MSGCQVSRRGTPQTRLTRHLQGLVALALPLRRVTDDNTNNNRQLCTHETVLFTGNSTTNAYTAYKMKHNVKMFAYLHGFVHRNESRFKINF